MCVQTLETRTGDPTTSPQKETQPDLEDEESSDNEKEEKAVAATAEISHVPEAEDGNNVPQVSDT